MNTFYFETFLLDFQFPTQEPFLFCVHHLDHYPEGTKNNYPDCYEINKKYLLNRNIGNDFQSKDGFKIRHALGLESVADVIESIVTFTGYSDGDKSLSGKPTALNGHTIIGTQKNIFLLINQNLEYDTVDLDEQAPWPRKSPIPGNVTSF